MKRKTSVLIAALLLIALAVGGTMAVRSYSARSRNVITTGGIHIQLFETNGEDNAPFEDMMTVDPGSTAGKNIRVKNVCNHDAWVRIRIDKQIVLAEGKTGTPDLDLVTVTPKIPTVSDWKLEDDGYFYYLPMLDGNNITTEPLPLDIYFDAAMAEDNMYSQCQVQIIVTAEATQALHNDAADATEAAGWPED